MNGTMARIIACSWNVLRSIIPRVAEQACRALMFGHFLVRLARSWLVYLGASLDRDLASPGLLGVREDGPAGGGTFRDPVAEPRPGSRSRAYVSGPSAGGWPKVALMTQVSSQYETSPGHRAGSAQNNGRKKREATPLVTDL